jgi:uroporphyrinogen-III synthase
VQIEQDLAGVLFGSPSAVLSFFAKNKWPQAAVAFAIGTSTAVALRGCGVQAVQQPLEPGWPALVQCCADYFSESNK